MIPQPSAWEIAQAVKDILLATGYAGEVAISPKFNIDPTEYISLVRSGSYYDGTVLEIGPGPRDPEGAALVTNRVVLINRFLSYGYIPTGPVGHGATESGHYISLAADAFAWALHEKRHLGFTTGHPTYANATVQHYELQEQEGQPRIQKDTYEAHHIPMELTVMSKRC